MSDKTAGAFKCVLCGSSDFQIVCRTSAQPNVSGDVVSCDICDLKSMYPLSVQSELNKRYEKNYFQCDSPLTGGYEDYESDRDFIKKTFFRRLPFFLSYFPDQKPRSVLDVGCATGIFLETMRDQGWKVSGIDVSPFAVQQCTKKGFPVVMGNLNAGNFQNESFDLITMWDVIEHLADPLASLRTCFNLLKKDGLLVLSTPDAGAFLSRLLGDYWLGYRSVGEHVYFFDRQSILKCMATSGFDIQTIRSAGKYMPIGRILTRLRYYTRIFSAILPATLPRGERMGLYVNPGDTMMVIARKSFTKASY